MSLQQNEVKNQCQKVMKPKDPHVIPTWRLHCCWWSGSFALPMEITQKTTEKHKSQRCSNTEYSTLKVAEHTKMAERYMHQTMLRCTQIPEHDESWYVRISHTPLDSRVKLALLVVNSFELRLTAFKNKFNNGRNESPIRSWCMSYPGICLLCLMSPTFKFLCGTSFSSHSQTVSLGIHGQILRFFASFT